MERWKNRSVNGDPGSNMGEYYASPGVLPCRRAAESLMTGYMREMRGRWNEHRVKKTGLHAIYGRMAEQAMKLALVAHEGGRRFRGRGRVGDQDGHVLRRADGAAGAAERVGQRPGAERQGHPSHHRRVVPCEPPRASFHSDLVLRTTRLKRQERRDLIEDAIVSGKVIVCEIDNGKSGPKPVFYKLSDV